MGVNSQGESKRNLFEPENTQPLAIEVTPEGTVQLVVPVNLNTQALPSTETVKFAGVPTVWAQCATVSVFAAASGAFTTEITDKVETINKRAKR